MLSFRGRRNKKTRGPGAAYRPAQQKSQGARRETRLRMFIIAAAYVVLLAAVTQWMPPREETRPLADFESIPPEDISAEVQFESEDVEQTRQARESAAAQEWDRYFVSSAQVEQQLNRLEERVNVLKAQRQRLTSAIRQALLDSAPSAEADNVAAKTVRSFAAGLVETHKELEGAEDPGALAVWLMPDPKSLPERVFDEQNEKTVSLKGDGPIEFQNLAVLEQLARSALEQTLAAGVLSSTRKAQQENDSERSIVIRRPRPVGELEETAVVRLSEAVTPALARQEVLAERLAAAVEQQSSADAETPRDWGLLREAAEALARLDVAPTLAFDEAATEAAKEAARNAVEPVARVVPRNRVIQRGGEPWDAQSIVDYQHYLEQRQESPRRLGSFLETLAAHAILVALFMAALVKGLDILTEKPRLAMQNLALALMVVCATAVLAKVISYFEPSGLLTPIAAGAILLAILTNVRLAAWVSCLTAAISSVLFDYDWRLLVLGSAMALAGISGTIDVRRRSDVNRAAIRATLAGLVVVIAVTLATESLARDEVTHRVSLILLNGALCLFIVPGLLSPLEQLFGITTPIQLLEYSDLNNELLSRLSVEVPATYAHSRMLGDLAEAAAISIGADGLLARVCAYYHDIGKLRRPEYFAENQTGPNVHDDLPPRLSARAISAHVSEGAEMAREFHLPQPIIDAIYEHHGTSMISFFYQQALSQQKHGDVREEDFRYPGPKPQSRETAILMICDAVESGVRSIKNPNEERVRELIDKIVTARANDRQFDECDLTLRELDIMKDVITKRMLTSLHGRISYPEQPPRSQPGKVIRMPGGAEQ